MAVALKDLIDISLLDYYDTKVKDWTIKKIEEKTTDLNITTRAELPEVGEIGALYIVEDAILTWDEETQNYESVGQSAGNMTWGNF